MTTLIGFITVIIIVLFFTLIPYLIGSLIVKISKMYKSPDDEPFFRWFIGFITQIGIGILYLFWSFLKWIGENMINDYPQILEWF